MSMCPIYACWMNAWKNVVPKQPWIILCSAQFFPLFITASQMLRLSCNLLLCRHTAGTLRFPHSVPRAIWFDCVGPEDLLWGSRPMTSQERRPQLWSGRIAHPSHLLQREQKVPSEENTGRPSERLFLAVSISSPHLLPPPMLLGWKQRKQSRRAFGISQIETKLHLIKMCTHTHT